MTKRILNIVPLVSDRWNELTRQHLESVQLPVVDPNLASVRHAEMLVSLGLSHSKLAWPSPAMAGSQCTLKWPATLRNQKDAKATHPRRAESNRGHAVGGG